MKRFCHATAAMGCAAAVCFVALNPHQAHAGVRYLEPSGGWRYEYDGTFNDAVIDSGCVGGICPPGYGAANDTQALDGNWQHDQSDKWDGSGPGEIGPVPEGDSPGGVAALVEGSTTYIRIQDAGNPELPGHGWIQGPQDPVNNNRRIFFGHRIETDGPLASELVLDNGLTFSIRARIPNSGPIDNIYSQDEMNNAVIRRWFETHPADYNQDAIVNAADFTVWRDTLGSTYDLRADADDGTLTGTPDGVVDQFDYDYWVANFGASAEKIGRGYPISNDGRGMFNIVQNDPGFFNFDSSIGFSLITSADIKQLCEGSPTSDICQNPDQSGGLIMNNGAGTSPSGSVDTLDPGTLNLVEIDDADLDDWHEFWITIEADGAIGTHTVKVYVDGSTSFTEFHVSENLNGDSEYIDDAWLTMGLSDTDLFGSVDVDFFAYSLGVITPVAVTVVPEPATAVLAIFMLGGLLVTCGARRRQV
jgi:hypothetical protein